MLFYKESECQGQLKNQVDKLVGQEIELKKQMKFGYSGSALYHLNKMTSKNYILLQLTMNQSLKLFPR